ncbi:hypothetical protein OF001_U250002 [Pseudomonas sp. OF001]|nr:hypothetical protein OF001_U250002 [Pseudomonas sp. OF001]
MVKGRPRHADVPVSEANDLNRMLGRSLDDL